MLTFLLQIEVKQLELNRKSCLTLKYLFISAKSMNFSPMFANLKKMLTPSNSPQSF